MLLELACLLPILAATTGSGARMPTEDHAPIIAFAANFSGSEPAIVERVKQFAASPPADPATIGFYSGEDDPAQNRVFLATVNLLDEAGKLSSVEDKYTPEIFAQWQEAGVIDAATLPPAAKAVFGPLIDGELSEAEAQAYRETLWTRYAEATQELERHIEARGKVLLSIDATSGDTMFFAAVSPDIAARWRDKALGEADGYRGGVRSPMWDRFWAHLNYALWAFDGGGRKGLPPGVKERVEAIPFAE